MKLYIEAKVQDIPVGYVEFTISSAYKEPFDCIENRLVEEGSRIIIVTATTTDSFKVKYMIKQTIS